MFFGRISQRVRWCLAIIWLCWVLPAGATEFKEGVHYQSVAKERTPTVPSGKEVIEFLWYDCGTCYAIQGQLRQWLEKKPSTVYYSRMPAVTEQKMEYYARVMVTAEHLKVLDKMHITLFTALHAHRRPLHEMQELEQFFAEYGVSSKQLRTVFNSGFVASKVRRAERLAQQFGLVGTPSFVVNGRYRVDPTMVSSPQELFSVIDFLLQK